MVKMDLFLDCDNTITNSTEAFIRTYNNNHNTSIDWTKVEKYDFSDQIPNLTSEEKYDIFGSKNFFDNLTLINSNTYEIARELNEKYNIIIASIGTPKNLSLKALWLEQQLPFIKNYCLYYNGDCSMNKSIINCSKTSIFVDDCHDNLLSVNSDTKIIFGDIYEWSKTLNGFFRCYNWTDLGNLLL